VFPEREQGPGAIYIEAADKVTLKKIREITFVNAKEILGIIYSSKKYSTKVETNQKKIRQSKWRCISKCIGKFGGVWCHYSGLGRGLPKVF
jgi:hypothetical protein